MICGNAQCGEGKQIEDVEEDENDLGNFTSCSRQSQLLAVAYETCFDKRLEVSAVAGFFHFFDWNEAERGGIDAVTQASRPRAIIEDMAEMGIGALGAHLSTHHAMGDIVVLDDFFIGERLAGKLGQPQPESNLSSELKSGLPETMSTYRPGL